MAGSPVFLINFTNRLIPAKPNYRMSIVNSQAILKSFIDLNSSVWFTLGSAEEPCFVTLRNLFTSTAGERVQNTKWPAVRYFQQINPS